MQYPVKMIGLTLFLASTLVLLVDHSETSTPKIPGSRPVLKTQGEGNPNGTIFDDVSNTTSAIFNVRSLSIISMYQVDYLQVTYQLANGSLYRAPEHGDGIFNPETVTLAKDEYIECIRGSTSYELINQLTFTINSPNQSQKRLIGPYGTTVGEHNFTFEGFVVGFHGKTGKLLLQNLGVYYLAPVKSSEYFGHSSAPDFVEHPDAKFPPVVKVNKIFIDHGSEVNSLQMEYQLHGGGIRLGEKHGGASGNFTTIIFEYGEGLVEIRGKTGGILHHTIKQLTFVSRKMGGSRALYGPFGKLGYKPFSISGNIIGYTGKAGKVFESLGVFYY